MKWYVHSYQNISNSQSIISTDIHCVTFHLVKYTIKILKKCRSSSVCTFSKEPHTVLRRTSNPKVWVLALTRVPENFSWPKKKRQVLSHSALPTVSSLFKIAKYQLEPFAFLLFYFFKKISNLFNFHIVLIHKQLVCMKKFCHHFRMATHI